MSELESPQIVALASRYALWLPVDTYLRAPWLARTRSANSETGPMNERPVRSAIYGACPTSRGTSLTTTR